MGVLKSLGKNKWVLVIVLALLAIAGGGVYSDQLSELIQSLLAQ
jgi:uncharacterized membrane protein